MSFAVSGRESLLMNMSNVLSAVTVHRTPSGFTVLVPSLDLEAVERGIIAFALETTGGNRTHAANLLHLTRSALLYRVRKHRIPILRNGMACNGEDISHASSMAAPRLDT
jgi:transcriptional regulator with GAF, ATPase, and Fis domain